MAAFHWIFHMNFSKLLPNYIKSNWEIFIMIALNLQINLWSIKVEFSGSQPNMLFSNILQFSQKDLSHLDNLIQDILQFCYHYEWCYFAIAEYRCIESIIFLKTFIYDRSFLCEDFLFSVLRRNFDGVQGRLPQICHNGMLIILN